MTPVPEIEVIVTLREWVEPAPFECAICERTIRADRWRRPLHQPPICFSCSNIGGMQTRIPGITRGDHHVLQRLKAVSDGLRYAANLEAYRARHGSL